MGVHRGSAKPSQVGWGSGHPHPLPRPCCSRALRGHSSPSLLGSGRVQADPGGCREPCRLLPGTLQGLGCPDAASALPTGSPTPRPCPAVLSRQTPPTALPVPHPLPTVTALGTQGQVPGVGARRGGGQLLVEVAEVLPLPHTECPAGTFGVNCSGSCSCGGAPCDRVMGQCLCPPGRTGDDCGAGEWQACPVVLSPCAGPLWVGLGPRVCRPQPWAVPGEPQPQVRPQQLQEPTLDRPAVWEWDPCCPDVCPQSGTRNPRPWGRVAGRPQPSPEGTMVCPLGCLFTAWGSPGPSDGPLVPAEPSWAGAPLGAGAARGGAGSSPSPSCPLTPVQGARCWARPPARPQGG